MDRPDCKYYELILALERSACVRLTDCIYAGDGYNLGISLGYPENAVSSFINKTPGCVHSYNESLMSCSNGLNEGHRVPIYFAYSLHVPEKVVVNNGIISLDPPSEKLAQNYMSCIRRIDNTLSNEIERNFATELSDSTGGKNIYSDSTYYAITNQ